MSQDVSKIVKSFQAGDTISAYRVLKGSGTNGVVLWDTTTAHAIGVSADYADSGSAIPVIIGGTAKVICGASVSAYAQVGPATDGSIVATTFATTTANLHIIGVALENGSTNSVIEVLLQPLNWIGV